MTPSQEHPKGSSGLGEDPAAASLRLVTLSKRSDFMRASRAPRVVMPGFILQMHKRKPEDTNGIRVGYTCSKKVGNAVARNRAKRRLREVARLVLPQTGLEGTDYVLVGRAVETANRPFEVLLDDLHKAVIKLHDGRA